MTSGGVPQPYARPLVLASLSTTLSVIPSLLVGAMAPFLRDEMQFSGTKLGLAVSSFATASAIFSIPGGELAERIGARHALRLGAGLSTVALACIGIVARDWWTLTWFLVLAGVGNAIAQPASNLALSRHVPRPRQGMAFGVKQASVPVATLLAGVAIPLLGIRFGWRAGFLGSALLASAYLVIVSAKWPGPNFTPASVERRVRRRIFSAPLIVVTVGCGIGAASSHAMGVFYVESAVAKGFDPSLAGYGLAFGGLVGVLARLLVGWQVDRRGAGSLSIVAGFLTVGAIGHVLLGQNSALPWIAVGTLVAYGVGWGWPGLFLLQIVRRHQEAPAAATGVTQVGAFMGGVLGPLSFGALVDARSFAFAWSCSAASLFVAAMIMQWGRRGFEARQVA